MATKSKTREFEGERSMSDRLETIDLRSKIEKGISQVSEVRELLYYISENDQMLGDMFDRKMIPQVDQLTQIGLTLGEIYGYTVADDLLESRDMR